MTNTVPIEICSRMTSLTFTPQFEPLNLGSPLWRIKSDRPAEYRLLAETLAENEAEFSDRRRG